MHCMKTSRPTCNEILATVASLANTPKLKICRTRTNLTYSGRLKNLKVVVTDGSGIKTTTHFIIYVVKIK